MSGRWSVDTSVEKAQIRKWRADSIRSLWREPSLTDYYWSSFGKCMAMLLAARSEPSTVASGKNIE